LKKTLPQLKKNLDKFQEVVKISADTSARKRAEGVKKFAQEFIANGSLTPKLKLSTKTRKAWLGYLYPDHPLYGLGEASSKSMYNGLKVRKLKSGYRVQPEGTHHSGFSMQSIFIIHEFGANLKNGGRIPARRLFKKSIAEQNFKDLVENKAEAKKLKKVLTK
jgi:hypothetical protein